MRFNRKVLIVLSLNLLLLAIPGQGTCEGEGAGIIHSTLTEAPTSLWYVNTSRNELWVSGLLKYSPTLPVDFEIPQPSLAKGLYWDVSLFKTHRDGSQIPFLEKIPYHPKDIVTTSWSSCYFGTGQSEWDGAGKFLVTLTKKLRGGSEATFLLEPDIFRWQRENVTNVIIPRHSDCFILKQPAGGMLPTPPKVVISTRVHYRPRFEVRYRTNENGKMLGLNNSSVPPRVWKYADNSTGYESPTERDVSGYVLWDSYNDIFSISLYLLPGLEDPPATHPQCDIGGPDEGQTLTKDPVQTLEGYVCPYYFEAWEWTMTGSARLFGGTYRFDPAALPAPVENVGFFVDDVPETALVRLD